LNPFPSVDEWTKENGKFSAREEKIMFDRVDVPFLVAAFASFIVSVVLWFLLDHDAGLFVGIWVPSILILWVGVRVRIQGR
jgi:hypothetical protein